MNIFFKALFDRIPLWKPQSTSPAFGGCFGLGTKFSFVKKNHAFVPTNNFQKEHGLQCLLVKNMYTGGYVALVTMLVVGAVMLTVGMAVVLNSINSGQGALSGIKKETSTGYVESCTEEALLQINNKSVLGSVIVLPEGSCTVTINSQSGSDWDFTVTGVIDGYAKSVRVTASRTTTVTVNSWKEI